MAAHRQALIALALLACGCASPQPAQQSSAAVPQRIISLIPAVTETLFAVGAGAQVVGIGTYDTYPPEIQSLPRVGGVIDPDTERILALKPDLVYVYSTQDTVISQLKGAGLPIELYRHGNLQQSIESIRTIGARAGRTDDANRIAAAIEKTVAEARSRSASRTKPSVLVVFGREEGTLRGIYASGGVGFVHDMLVAAGGRNVFDDVKRESVQASLESIMERAPDVVLEIRAPIAGRANRPQDLASVWAAAPALPAVRNGRVRALIDERLVVPGPRIGEGILLIENALWK